MAAMIIGNITMAWFMTPFADEKPFRDELYFLHKSFGMTILALIFIRIAIRLRNSPPPLPPGLPQIDVKLATVVHFVLYGLMVAMPVLGYVQSSAYEYSDGVHFFGLLVPEIIADNQQIFDYANLFHRISGYTLLAMVLLHISGVIKHRFFDAPENDCLGRML